jgi:hypothetical protein
MYVNILSIIAYNVCVPDRSIQTQQASSTHQCEYKESKDVRVYSCCVVFCVVLPVMCFHVIDKFLSLRL